MPIESKTSNHRVGWIEIICGGMFSGKTKALISRLKEAESAQQKIAIFKPVIDTRYHAEKIVSHDASALDAKPISDAKMMLEGIEEAHVVAVDEAQFFGQEIVWVVEQLANAGKRVIVAGLDMDYEGKPFGPMPSLLSVANYITKLHAQCVLCGGEASYSYRKDISKDQVAIGEKDKYEARCRNCFNS